MNKKKHVVLIAIAIRGQALRTRALRRHCLIWPPLRLVPRVLAQPDPNQVNPSTCTGGLRPAQVISKNPRWKKKKES